MFHINLWVVLAALAVTVTGEECYNTQTKGSDYRGAKDTTRYGTVCTDWTTGVRLEVQSNIDATDKFGVDSGVSDGEFNLCRNPVPDEQTEPWCYVNVGLDVTRSVCGVPACPEDETKDETEDDTEDDTGDETRKQLENNSAMFSSFSLFLVALALLMSI